MRQRAGSEAGGEQRAALTKRGALSPDVTVNHMQVCAQSKISPAVELAGFWHSHAGKQPQAIQSLLCSLWRACAGPIQMPLCPSWTVPKALQFTWDDWNCEQRAFLSEREKGGWCPNIRQRRLSRKHLNFRCSRQTCVINYQYYPWSTAAYLKPAHIPVPALVPKPRTHCLLSLVPTQC